jgi:exodeoxyribonuclease VIII
MVDIETLSTQPNAVILSIGAVIFDPYLEENHPEHFYQEIDPASQPSPTPFDVDPETVKWWEKQPRQPQGTLPIEQAIQDFDLFLQSRKWTYLWANSPSFDFVILRHAFRYCEIEWPQPYWLERDVRTFCGALLPNLPKLPVSHNALHDCQQQILKVQRGYELLATLAKPLSGHSPVPA